MTAEAVKQPELTTVKNRLARLVEEQSGMLENLNSKLQSIHYYTELESPSGDVVKEPESLVDEINYLLKWAERNNERLSFSLRHLNEIV